MKLWKDMTAEEKGALLLAYHEGAVIEFYSVHKEWKDCKDPLWCNSHAYRVKPKTEKGAIWYLEDFATVHESTCWGYTHKVTFDIVDGEPDVSTVEMSKI
jgi:hypothetical protein